MNNKLKNEWGIIGHSDLLTTLEQIIESKSFPQAILLQGPAGIGKMTILKKMAGFMQEHGASSKADLDVMFLDDDGQTLKIETVRKAKEFMLLSKQGSYKLCLIKNIERMTVPAANSLLKILEEPPQNAVFLLSSSNPESLLDTIISRCRVFKCEPLSESDILAGLNSLFPEQKASALNELIQERGLSLGESISTLGNKNLEEKHSQYDKILNSLYENPELTNLMAIADKLAEEDRAETIYFLKLFLKKAYRQTKFSQDIIKLSTIQKTINLIESNTNQRLALEVLFLQYFADFASI